MCPRKEEFKEGTPVLALSGPVIGVIAGVVLIVVIGAVLLGSSGKRTEGDARVPNENDTARGTRGSSSGAGPAAAAPPHTPGAGLDSSPGGDVGSPGSLGGPPGGSPGPSPTPGGSPGPGGGAGGGAPGGGAGGAGGGGGGA